MKRIVFEKLVIAVIAASVVFTSCDKDDDIGRVQLLETIIYEGSFYEKYEYDNQNRITKISMYSDDENVGYTKFFTYSENDLVEVFVLGSTEEYTKIKNKISVTKKNNSGNVYSTATIDLDNDELPTKIEELNEEYSEIITYQYQRGNMTNRTLKRIQNNETQEFTNKNKFDNKKSPYYHCKTPNWYLIENYSVGKSNIIEVSYGNKEKTLFKYEYDRAGFPTKCTMKLPSGGETVKEFKYKYK